MSQKKTDNPKSEIEIIQTVLLDIVRSSESDRDRIKAVELLIEIKKQQEPHLWLE